MPSKDASNDAREPDELDALLERSAAQSSSASNPNYNGTDSASTAADGAPTSVATETSTGKSHRKSYTMTLMERTGGSVRGLFGGQRSGNTKRRRQHRKNKSSVSDLIDAAMKNVDLEPIAEDFRQTASSVKHTWIEELEAMDQGVGSGFFDMTATRSCAILPEDLPDLGFEVRMLTSSTRQPMPRVEELEPDEETEMVEKLEVEEETPTKEELIGGPMILNLLLLLGAVFAHSSNATALHMLDGVSPTMKLFWRMSASYLIFVPFTMDYLRQEGLPKLSFSGWVTFVSAAAFYTCQTLSFYTALEYTTIGNVVIYANSQALLLIVGKVFIGEPIHILEAIGVVVAFSGAILCSKDSEQSSQELDRTHALFGDLLALCSAAFGVAYLTVARVVRSQMSVSFFITFVMFLGSLMVLAYLSINPHEEVSFDMDPFQGSFGGFDISHHRLEVLAYLAIVVNVGGSMGMIQAMQHFDTIIIAVATLMEPLAASLIAFVCKAGLLPGPLGWLGNLLVVFGTLCVVYPSMGKNDGGAMH